MQRQKLRIIEEDEKMVSDSNNPIKLLVRDEELERLSIAMTQLSYPQREAIVLYLHGGLKFRQIAKFQEVPIKTAQSRFRCGLNKLRLILNSEE
jgi:DNA-directed RNA polymerase specialized sigma24 family protein